MSSRVLDIEAWERNANHCRLGCGCRIIPTGYKSQSSLQIDTRRALRSASRANTRGHPSGSNPGRATRMRTVSSDGNLTIWADATGKLGTNPAARHLRYCTRLTKSAIEDFLTCKVSTSNKFGIQARSSCLEVGGSQVNHAQIEGITVFANPLTIRRRI